MFNGILIDKGKVNLPLVFLKKTEFRGWLLLLLWLLPSFYFREDILRLGSRILSLWKKSGSKFLVLYLKEASIILYKFIARDRYVWISGSPRVRLDGSGLPIFIPRNLRVILITREWMCVKIVLSVLQVYRIIRFKSFPDLTSITDPFTGSVSSLPGAQLRTIQGWLQVHMGGLSKFRFRVGYRMIFSSGPNIRPSVVGLLLDSLALLRAPLLFGYHILSYITAKGGFRLLLLWFLSLPLGLVLFFFLGIPQLHVGRLSEKEEAAGKVRLFAIPDYYSQCILYPFHSYLSDVLKTIPQDGMFDQMGPIRLLFSNSSYPEGSYHSFDLKSATDRLPLHIQADVLSLFVGKFVAWIWKGVMSSRVWHFEGEGVRYSVGQPMGAYSSWAVMALTHHFIVQVSAFRAGHDEWFPGYAILGDDVVIASDSVAHQYLGILRELGVKVSAAKSLESNQVLEFARRLESSGFNYSPIGARVLLQALRSYKFIPALFLDALGKGINYPRFSGVVGMIRDLPKVSRRYTSWIQDILMVSLLGPFGIIVNMISLAGNESLVWLWNHINPMFPNASPQFYSSILSMAEYKYYLSERERLLDEYLHAKENLITSVKYSLSLGIPDLVRDSVTLVFSEFPVFKGLLDRFETDYRSLPSYTTMHPTHPELESSLLKDFNFCSDLTNSAFWIDFRELIPEILSRYQSVVNSIEHDAMWGLLDPSLPMFGPLGQGRVSIFGPEPTYGEGPIILNRGRVSPYYISPSSVKTEIVWPVARPSELDLWNREVEARASSPFLLIKRGWW